MYRKIVPLLVGLSASLVSSVNMNQSDAQAQSVSVRAETVEAMSAIYEPRQFVSKAQVTLQYRLLKPIATLPGKKFPVVLFLHGAGERGDDNLQQLVHGAKEFADPLRREQFPCYVVAPQCPKGKKWSEVDWSKESSTLPTESSESMQAIKELLDEMVEDGRVDANRIYITGLSMGGYGTWDAIARYSNFFAAAAPVCGGGDPTTVDRFAKLPIWCFHGRQDSDVKPIRSQEMVEALKKIGSAVKYTEYPDLKHDSWSATYSNPKLYDWMFAQSKRPTTPE